MMAKEPGPLNSSTGDSQRVLCDKCRTESVGLLPRHLSNGAATSSVNFVDERDKSDNFHKPNAGVLFFATFEVGLLREEVVAALLAASTASINAAVPSFPRLFPSRRNRRKRLPKRLRNSKPQEVGLS